MSPSIAAAPPSTPRSPSFALRPAEPRDVEAIVALIRELAEFEHLTHLVQITPQTLHPHLFGPKPVVEAVVATGLDADGPVVGFALYFTNFSTFLDKPGLDLEDLYVQPEHRGGGLGRAFLSHLARLAVERGCGRFEWSVLDWNANAIGFYEKMGATVMPEWRICRLAGDSLAAYGRSADPG